MWLRPRNSWIKTKEIGRSMGGGSIFIYLYIYICTYNIHVCIHLSLSLSLSRSPNAPTPHSVRARCFLSLFPKIFLGLGSRSTLQRGRHAIGSSSDGRGHAEETISGRGSDEATERTWSQWKWGRKGSGGRGQGEGSSYVERDIRLMGRGAGYTWTRGSERDISSCRGGA